MGREVELGPSPTELDVGVVALRLGHQRHPRHESERVPEVGELELPPQALVALALPLRSPGPELCRLLLGQRRRALLAGLAVFGCEFAHLRKFYTFGGAGG